MTARWCAKDRNGRWCALMTDKRPAEDTTMCGTMCGEVIAFPWGIERREPTCHECRTRLGRRRRAERDSERSNDTSFHKSR